MREKFTYCTEDFAHKYILFPLGKTLLDTKQIAFDIDLSKSIPNIWKKFSLLNVFFWLKS